MFTFLHLSASMVAVFFGFAYLLTLRLRESEAGSGRVLGVLIFVMNFGAFMWVAIGFIGEDIGINGAGHFVILAIVAISAAAKTFFHDMRLSKENDHAPHNTGNTTERRGEGKIPRRPDQN